MNNNKNQGNFKGLFITLEGSDGAGKTTLGKSVSEKLTAVNNIRFQRRKDFPSNQPVITKAMDGVSKLLWDRGDCEGDNRLPVSYWLHLQAAWHASSFKCYIELALSNSTNVLLDGWFYKFYAKMLLLGYTKSELDLFFRDAGVPDIVILIDRDLDEIWQNARSFNQSEMGLHDNYEDLGKQSFLSYQTRIRNQYLEIAKTNSWIVYRPHTNATIEEDTIRLSELIQSQFDT